jgi:hypothetical protein
MEYIRETLDVATEVYKLGFIRRALPGNTLISPQAIGLGLLLDDNPLGQRGQTR